MKTISQTSALLHLTEIREDLREGVTGYEHRAKSCITCDTPGACCLDEHFVNVRISRLEAVAIGNVIRGLPPEKQAVSSRRRSMNRSKDTDSSKLTAI